MTATTPTAPQRVFITGATGVIGARAVPLLVARGHEVVAVGRTSEKRAQLQTMGARAIALDIFDVAAAARALEGVTTVINLATHMPPSSFRMMLPWEWRENDLIRREGSAALVEAALASGVTRFIEESFAPAYEDGGDRWIEESWPLRPAPYNRTILDAERSAAHFADKGGVGIIARFAALYGPDNMLREWIVLVKRGYAPLPGPPSAYWSSLAHEDAASAVAAMLEVASGAYSVCDDYPLTRAEYHHALASAIHANDPKPLPKLFTTLGGKSVELLSRSQRISNAKLRAATGWTPRSPSATDGIPAAVRELGVLR